MRYTNWRPLPLPLHAYSLHCTAAYNHVTWTCLPWIILYYNNNIIIILCYIFIRNIYKPFLCHCLWRYLFTPSHSHHRLTFNVACCNETLWRHHSGLGDDKLHRSKRNICFNHSLHQADTNVSQILTVVPCRSMFVSSTPCPFSRYSLR